jgi:23S rRNA (adenine-N6)-dimethyltransferase
VSGQRRRTARDRRRRSLGQNFLVDRGLIDAFNGDLDLDASDHVVEVGAGSGALTLPLLATGAALLAVEADPVWADRLRARIDGHPAGSRVHVVCTDVRRLRWPAERPYRVVSNVPFAITTELLGILLDDPANGPRRADLIVQFDVARKHATEPAVALRTAAWAPWWSFELGRRIGRDAFRPRPSVDAAVLTVRRREPPLLPLRLAPGFREALRPMWEASPAVTHPSPALVRRPWRGRRRRRG